MSIIIGNWKMHGTEALTRQILTFLQSRAQSFSGKMIICPPFTWLPLAAQLLKDSSIFLGAQDCHYALSGAYTGDISANMIKEIGCRYVILGHSERRDTHNEDNSLIKAKVKTAQSCELNVILCVGEKKEVREKGQSIAFVVEQMQQSLPQEVSIKHLLIAYEPCWAIGSGQIPEELEIVEMHQALRKYLQKTYPEGEMVPILYGGSVTSQNAEKILVYPNVDGVLVGGASLKEEDFWKIAVSS